MSGILALAFWSQESGLDRKVRETLAAAARLSAELGQGFRVGFVGGANAEAAGAAAAAGAEAVYSVPGDAFAVSRYGTDAAALEALCRRAEPAYVVAVESNRMHRSLPGVAYRVNGRIDTHVGGWEVADGELRIQRWFYRQRIQGVLTRSTRPWFLLLDAGVVAPWEGRGTAATVEEVPVEVPSGATETQVEGVREPEAGEQTIRPDADLLFVAGAGWTKKQADGQVHVAEAERLILDFLRLTQASLGGSKSIVDQAGEGQATLSFMTHLHQVGQTGATPRHPKGLATCCHGEEPHVVGWRFIRERRAVNLDPGCGWAQGKADVLYVADAFELIRRVNELLQEG
ncbi:MAG: hypothetical protein Kow00109_04090 [Acidobacteriota bacterium]